ncbi:MAG: ABC transporter permease [Thermomicrobiales bacterium]|nr:ABC transporter permease [Thermomicrobiales bacterium]
MIRTILQLTTFGNEQSRWRLAGIVLGIAVGVGLLLTLLGAAQGLTDRDQRRSWLNVNFEYRLDEDGEAYTLTDDTVMVGRFTDYVAGDAIERIDVAATQTTNERTPWGDPLPAPGTYFASPALIELIESLPGEQLGDRFGTLIGPIPDSALGSPDSLYVLAGVDEATLGQFQSWWIQPALAGDASGSNVVYRIVMVIGGIAMFLPVLLLISTTTQLGGAQRAERLSTLRLIGATPESVTRVAAIEMALLALTGALLGTVGWWLLRPVGARFVVDEGRFFPYDLDVSIATIVAIAIGAMLTTGIAAGVRIARMGIGPLGVTRERSEHAPSPLSLLPLLAGLALFGGVTWAFKTSNVDVMLLSLAIIGGFGLTSLGIIWAGPWLTNCASRLAARFAGSAAGVVAASRIRRHPEATFRSVSGLVLAVFTVTVFAASASSVLEADDPRDGAQVFPLSTVYAYIHEGATEADLAGVEREIEAVPGVLGAVIAMEDRNDPGSWLVHRDDAPLLNVRIEDDRAWVRFDAYNYIWGEPDAERPGQPGAATLAGDLPFVLMVATDGSDGVIDTVRTRLEASNQMASLARTRADDIDVTTRKFVNSLANLAYIGIAITILIAGISLTVATAASMLERKRIFGLLRLMGMPNGVISRIVAFEAVAPLVAVLAITIGLGFLISWMMVEGLSYSRTLHAPDIRYYLAILGSLGLAVLSVLAVTGLVHRNTGVNQTRFE